MSFKPAKRGNLLGRVTLDGPPGAGKTTAGLILAHLLADGGAVFGIDTERGSMSKYADKLVHGVRFNFCVKELTQFSPRNYTEAIREAAKLGCRALLIDSLSHAWEGTGGALDMVDQKASTTKGGSYFAWKDVTPLHREMVDTMLGAPMHVITTMRVKTERVAEKDGSGRTVIRELGLKPIQREGMEYEFDLVIDIDKETQRATVAKTRCDEMPLGRSTVQPGPDFFAPFVSWLKGGSMSPAAPPMNVTWEPQPNNAQVYDLHGPCTTDQQEAIANLADALQMGPEDLRAVLNKRGVSRRAELTYAAAQTLIENMTAMHDGLAGVPF